MWDIHEKIDILADQINAAEEEIKLLQEKYDALTAGPKWTAFLSGAVQVSKDIHALQDTLRDLKDERDALIDLLFDEP